MDKRLVLPILFMFILLSTAVIAADTYQVAVRPKVGGVLQPNTAFDYDFNFTVDSGCTDVLESGSATITTDDYGVGAVEISTGNFSWGQSKISYLCLYRNSSLEKVYNVSSGIFDQVYGWDAFFGHAMVTGLGYVTSSLNVGAYLSGMHPVNIMTSGGSSLVYIDSSGNTHAEGWVEGEDGLYVNVNNPVAWGVAGSSIAAQIQYNTATTNIEATSPFQAPTLIVDPI